MKTKNPDVGDMPMLTGIGIFRHNLQDDRSGLFLHNFSKVHWLSEYRWAIINIGHLYDIDT